MPRTKRPAYQAMGKTPEAVQAAVSWFASADAGVDGVASWDLKEELLTTAVLGMLSTGRGIMFGTGLSGTAVSVTIYEGDAKSRKWVKDSIELENVLLLIIDQINREQASPK
jgi:hypothetical protein